MTGDRQEEVSRSEPRLDFIQDFTLKSMRCKQDKWQRMIVSDDVRRFVLDFIEKGTTPAKYFLLQIIWKKIKKQIFLVRISPLFPRN